MELNAVTLAWFLSSFVIGVVFGGMAALISRRVVIDRQMRLMERKTSRMMADARVEAKSVLDEARREGDKFKAGIETENRERRTETQREEQRVTQKLDSLERKLEAVDQRERGLASREKELESLRAGLSEVKERQLKQLEAISGMSSAEAKQVLQDAMQVELREETSRRLKEWEIELKRESDSKAQEILSQVIQRCASDIVSETTVSVIPLPSDEMKGRLIGREGRNIRALEQATGVDLIIDDTPEAVTISSFDGVRREVTRLSLEKLIRDGRIHPARIEEVVAKTKEEVDAIMQNAGEQAAYEVGVHGLRPELIKLIGRLKYRTSYGQNMLAHSIESAHLAGMIASELGTNVAVAKKAALLHDIGKAVDHEVEGSHAAIGADLVKQWEKSPDIVQAIAGHHFETNVTSVLGFIVAAADAISGARPGARRESLENYLKRLRGLEDIANSFSGVEKSYAIQAGREVRIMVSPEKIDDLAAVRLARDIVKKIEETMEYPGQIKVTVLRETRAVEYAK
ncbi:MAG: ribonuclease Y [Chloroflexota bacterium]